MSLQKIKIRVYSDSKDVSSVKGALAKLETYYIDLIISNSRDAVIDPNDITVIQIENLESALLSKIIDMKSSFSNKIIFVVPDDKALLISTLIKLGFTDIFVFPFEVFKFTSFVSETLDKYKNKLQNELVGSNDFAPSFFSITSTSGKFNRVYNVAKKVSKNSAINVLILGETGTGKGLLARTIHQMGNPEAPFVDVLCTAIPETLLESELFGHEKGAFTNAQSRKLGLFELAENGTIFLDEIGDLSLNLQSKLLRAIEKKVIRRLGGLFDIPINTRIISATNKNLPRMIEEKTFRSDLYYRLNVVSIDLPPLRDRGKDIILLAKYFINMFNKQFGKNIVRIDKDVEKFLLNYPWPGNIREFRNAIERAVLLGDRKNLQLKFFTQAPEYEYRKEKESEKSRYSVSFSVDYNKTNLAELEKMYAKKVLGLLDGKKSYASKALGIARTKLDRLLK